VKTLAINNGAQVIFNVWKAIIEKRLQAIMADEEIIPAPIEGAACKYRIPGYPNCGCAIGVNIPDDIYDLNMEGKGIYSLLRHPDSRYENEKYLFITTSTRDVENILTQLQGLHDLWATAISEREWRRNSFFKYLRKISNEYNVEIPSQYKEVQP